MVKVGVLEERKRKRRRELAVTNKAICPGNEEACGRIGSLIDQRIAIVRRACTVREIL